MDIDTTQADLPLPTTFFIVGALRTGSSLMARCIDDHEQAICLCESEINRCLFPGHYHRLHFNRMLAHGFTHDDVIHLLDRRRPCDVDSLLAWYEQCRPMAERVYAKPHVKALGDKSPDFYRDDHVVRRMADRSRLIYTVRDPRAVFRSIWRQSDSSEEMKHERCLDFIGNVRAWRPYWDRPNILVSRYEDLVRDPVPAMARVYAHLGLPMSKRFLEPFPRLHPVRFLWETAIDMRSGAAKPFDYARAEIIGEAIEAADLDRLTANEDVAAYCAKFGY